MVVTHVAKDSFFHGRNQLKFSEGGGEIIATCCCI